MKVEQGEGFSKITLPEKIDFRNGQDFKDALQSLYEHGCKTIMVDCVNLQMMNSIGLGSLLLYQKHLKKRGGELKIINANNGYIKYLFETIELDRVISIE